MWYWACRYANVLSDLPRRVEGLCEHIKSVILTFNLSSSTNFLLLHMDKTKFHVYYANSKLHYNNKFQIKIQL